MKKLLQITLLFTLISSQIDAQTLTSYFDFKVFQVPGEGILLETYFDIKGESVEYLPLSDSTHQASVELKVIVSKGQGIKDFRKESIKSPIAITGHSPDFISIQRFILPKGVYELDMEIKDEARPEQQVIAFKREIDLNFNSDRTGLSDIELLAGFKKSEADSKLSKAGLDMLPYMSTVYQTEFNELLFYVELYGMDRELKENEAFLLRYFLEDIDHETVQMGTEVNKRKKASKVVSELGLLDLSSVASGQYNLRVEARNRENELICEKELTIVRINQNLKRELNEEQINLTFVGEMTDKDSLLEYIYSLRPISQELDRMIIDNQSSNFTLMECKSFFYSFWEERDPINPSVAWSAYKKNVELVDEKFGTSNREGYETDMGRIYLVYGAPNSLVNESNDPETYPYQIWHYYKAGKFNDKRFVFYDREILQREYTLLHSDVPGEVRNPRWNIIINSRSNSMWNVDQNSAGGNGAQRLQQLYDSPR